MDLVPDIDRLTQIFSNAIAPAFFLGAVAAFVSLMMSRLAAVNEPSRRPEHSLIKTALRLEAARHLVRSRAAHACSVTASFCRWAAVCARHSYLRYFLQVSSLVCIMPMVRPFYLLPPLCCWGLRCFGSRRKHGMPVAN